MGGKSQLAFLIALTVYHTWGLPVLDKGDSITQDAPNSNVNFTNDLIPSTNTPALLYHAVKFAKDIRTIKKSVDEFGNTYIVPYQKYWGALLLLLMALAIKLILKCLFHSCSFDPAIACLRDLSLIPGIHAVLLRHIFGRLLYQPDAESPDAPQNPIVDFIES